MNDPTRPGEPGAVVVALGLATIFTLCTTSVAFAPRDSDVAAWWPAAGVATAMLLLSRPRRWMPLLLGFGVVSAAANAVAGRALDVSIAFGVTNSTENLVTALLLGALTRRPWLRTSRDFARLCAAGLVGAAVAGVLAGSTVALLLDGAFLQTLSNVLASHGAASLVVLPLALLVADPEARVPPTPSPRLVGMAQMVVALAAFALVHRIGQHLPLSFVPLPLLVWGAQVLSLRALAVEVLAAGTIITVLTAEGGGPFAAVRLSEASVGVLVQLDLAAVVLVSLPLGVVAAQRRRAQADLVVALGNEQRAVARLEELDRTRSEFLGTISHEMRTPMTSILGFTQVLSDGTAGDLTAAQHDLVRRVDRQSRRLLSMVENVLTIVRVETSSTLGATGWVEMGQVVEAAVEATQYLRWERQVDLRLLPSSTRSIPGDRAQLVRVATNLIGNAIKFTPDGGIVHVAWRDTSSDSVLLEVRDTGVGIPLAEQSQVFERFYRASTARNVDVQGTGLGLAIVRDVVAHHGGDIWIESTVGEGTSVSVRLPAG
ncbi:hypothetical protein BH11ACT8_BH11ACT8_04250 [soil metagenome]